MPAFEVRDMSCNHCVQAITKAIQAADPQAKVEIDLDKHRISVTGGTLDAMAVGALITQAGYTPVALA